MATLCSAVTGYCQYIVYYTSHKRARRALIKPSRRITRRRTTTTETYMADTHVDNMCVFVFVWKQELINPV